MFCRKDLNPRSSLVFARRGPCGLEIMEGYLYNDDPGTNAFLGDHTLGCRLFRGKRDPCHKARMLTNY